MEFIKKTLALEHLNLNYALGLGSPISSSREVLNIKIDDSDDAHRPQLKYFGVGIGGDVGGVVRQPSKRNLTLFSLIPIRITNANDEFRSGETRDDYRFRYPLMNGADTIGHAYYLKVLKNNNNGNTIFTETINTDNDTLFKYSDADIRDFLGDIGSNYSLPYTDSDIDSNIVERAILRCIIKVNDINSVISFHDNEKYGFVSEIGLYTGFDSMAVSGSTTYIEAKDVQLSYANCFNALNLTQLNTDLNIDYEITG